jgi:2-keto-4-pentenoate hydratase/2-oxohepta-3-ene-1,7-dioic acid hydratase in catechol pathway
VKLFRYVGSNGPEYGIVEGDRHYKAVGQGFSFEKGEPVDGRVSYLAPVEPRQIIGIGQNYRRHAAESNSPAPEFPIIFFKNVGAVNDPGKAIVLPRTAVTHKPDYEGELAVVLGKDCRGATEENALDYVLGYTCANDVSARDWQRDWGGSQWCRAKSFDTFCPLGPVLVTADEITDPNALHIKTTLNGEVVQDWGTDDMIFNVRKLITFASTDTTLPALTVILTGTPHGVGMGRKPPLWLKAGDTVTVTIDGIGSLTNPVE